MKSLPEIALKFLFTNLRCKFSSLIVLSHFVWKCGKKRLEKESSFLTFYGSMLMNKEQIIKLYDEICSGTISRKKALGNLAEFIAENHRLFDLHYYDEDFQSEVLLALVEKGDKMFDYYKPDRSDFFRYFYYYVLGLVNSVKKNRKEKECKDYLIFEENVSSYTMNEKNYSIQNSFDSKMFTSLKRVSYTPLSKNQLQSIYKKILAKCPNKQILVVALKASFYLTDFQIKKVCELYKIEEYVFYDTIQYCKMSLSAKSTKRQKAVERRNFDYFHHRKCTKKILDISACKEKADAVTIKNQLVNLDSRHYYHWITLNEKFEKGFLYLRPTNKTISEILGICERQVAYYINSAKNLLKKENLQTMNDEK